MTPMPQTPEQTALERIRQAAEIKAETLDLSHLKLTTLPDEIWDLTHLKELLLFGNSLANVPPQIKELNNLASLKLAHNKLSTLPHEVWELPALKELYISGNPLPGIPAEIWQRTDWEGLGLGELCKNGMPPELFNFTQLKKLSIWGNNLSSLPPGIVQLTNLTEFYISGNQLASLPPEIGQLTNLTQLDLSDNQLTSLSPEIGKLTNLTQLDISRNQLASLPPEISQLTNLTQLDIWANKLASLPPEIVQLTNLTQLDISRNQLASLPPEIVQLTNLTQLSIGSNQLASLPPEIVQLTNLTQLDIWGNQLASLPPEIGQLTNLTNLNLSGNQLASLPPEIVQLTNLTQLSIGSNQLASLPPEIVQLTNLTQLDLAGDPFAFLLIEKIGQLTFLPSEIVQLTNLTNLNLSGNQLASLPPEIGKLTNLTNLNLSSNQLASLLPEIDQLTNLTQLDLSSNQLASLPPEIGKLFNLTELNIMRNQLTSLPKEIVKLHKLKNINLWSNPLEIAIPIKWMKNDDEIGKFMGDDEKFREFLGSTHAREILIYYKQIHEEGGRPLGEARVLVVGEADAGKTKLLRALLKGEHGKNFVETRDPTDGIEVNSFEAEGVSLRFWDFGGQEIMHATHRFFLSHRCVYVLVADSTRDSNYNEEKIEYWLELLKFYGGDSPVLLAASKVENFSLNVNERGLQEKYTNLVRAPALRTSAKTGAGIEDLRRAIFEQAKSLPSVNVMLPRTFLAVKDALEEMKRNEKVKVIEESIYRRLCEENGITEEERQNTLLGLLHDMGVVLHYEDDRLSDFGILNPDWATGGVYKVVNSPQIKESHGRFTLAQLKAILADEEMYPASMRRRIVDLMKKFELTFELPLEKDTFILPSALPVNQPELSGWDAPAMTFEYRYPVLQSSVLHRFVVAAHDLILNNQVWYSGVVIARGDHQALIKSDTRAKRITVKVKGAEEARKEFLYFIRLQFERIHGEEAKPEEYIYPMPCPNLSLSYEKIKKLLKAGVSVLDEIYEDKPVKINLRELLDGFITPEERRKDEEREQLESKGMDRIEKERARELKGGDTYNYNINVQGNGNALATGERSQATQTVQNSFNTFPAEVQSALVELMKATESLLQKAEESEHRDEVKEELESLQSEAKKSKPKQERVKVTVEGLKKAAENLKDIGVPVITIAVKVLQLLNAMP